MAPIGNLGRRTYLRWSPYRAVYFNGLRHPSHASVGILVLAGRSYARHSRQSDRLHGRIWRSGDGPLRHHEEQGVNHERQSM